MNIEQQIRDYIAKNLIFSNNGYQYADETSFLEEGIVDSQGVMELVLFVEDAFGVKVDDQEIIPDNFDSITNLTAYVRRKTNQVQ
jgi:acyl carrier protein